MTLLSAAAVVLVVMIAILLLALRRQPTLTLADEADRSEGPHRGPEPGKGAVIHHSSGNDDFDGRSGDVLPPGASGSRRNPA